LRKRNATTNPMLSVQRLMRSTTAGGPQGLLERGCSPADSARGSGHSSQIEASAT